MTPCSARAACSSPQIRARWSATSTVCDGCASSGSTRSAPGHGPVVFDPVAKIDEYLAHRLKRERRLQDAIAGGARTVEEMLDGAWGEVPAALRPAAAVTLAAHLDKLADEGRLPSDVQRPQLGLTVAN